MSDLGHQVAKSPATEAQNQNLLTNTTQHEDNPKMRGGDKVEAE